MSNKPATIARQQQSLITADAWGEVWSQDEINLLAEFAATDTNHDLAAALSRSLYAIESAKARLARGELRATTRATRAATTTTNRRDGVAGRAYVGWTEADGDE